MSKWNYVISNDMIFLGRKFCIGVFPVDIKHIYFELKSKYNIKDFWEKKIGSC